MTTMAAMLGGLPLAIGAGVGGNCASPWASPSSADCSFPGPHAVHDSVIYLYMDRLRMILAAFRKWLTQALKALGRRRRGTPSWLMNNRK